MKIKLFLITAIVTVLLFTGCTSNTTPQKVDLSSSSQNINADNSSAEKVVETPIQTEFLLGDTIKVENLQFTVTGTRKSSGGMFAKPKAGNEYLMVDVLVQNVGTKTEGISSMMMFSLSDKDGYSYDTAFTDETKGNVDGNIMAGKYIRGELAFEVPSNGSYKLQINPEVLGLSSVFMVDLNQKSTADISLPDKMDISNNVEFGTQMNIDDVNYTVNSFRTSTGDGFMKPADGFVFYIVDAEITNNSSETVPISSLMMFKLYDGQGYEQDTALMADVKGSMDGDVLPGSKLRGEIAYEVPVYAKNLELWVQIPTVLDTEMYAVSIK